MRIFDNRELSWLKFNQRVLSEAEDTSVPLLERLTFASIFQSNLDEFFMVRVGTLFDQMNVDPDKREDKTNMTSREQLDAVFRQAKMLEEHKDRVYKSLLKAMEKSGICYVPADKMTSDETDHAYKYFKKEIQPILSPLIIDKRHPLPFIKSGKIYIAAQLESKSGTKLGLLSVSELYSRIIKLKKVPFRFVLSEDIIFKYVPEVFENYKVLDKTIIRITRNADISEDDDEFLECDFDFREIMEELIKKRKKLSPVRLQTTGNPNSTIIKYLCKRLGIENDQIFTSQSPLDLSFAFALRNSYEGTSLCYSQFSPSKHSMISDSTPVAEQVMKKDMLLFYPFESMRPFIRFLREIAVDPNVVSVKITLYRLARNSQIIDALIDMAENGKDVLVLVELRARFDEENNILWSKKLEEAGCTVIYGPQGIKVHSKLLLVTRKSGIGFEYITQIGTGNYNEKTSELYTDLSLITANREIAGEALEIFNALSLGHLVEDTRHLLVSPLSLQNKVVKMIDDEIFRAQNGEKAYIGIKINSLSDKYIIEKLAEASQAGVKVDLIIRGLCCLVSKVKGQTENIRVVSIVGRFLEHSRIYMFGTKERRKIYISSADFMTRNTVRRIEVAVPVYDKELKGRIENIFDILLSDNVKARIQCAGGAYKHRSSSGKKVDSQKMFIEMAKKGTECEIETEVSCDRSEDVSSRFFREFLRNS